MRLQVLKDELTNDPLAKGYLGMTDEQARASLMNVTEESPRGVLSAHEVFEAVEASDLTALSAVDLQRLQMLLSMGSVDIQGSNTRSVLAGIFGAGATTRANLIALQTETVSRASILGLGLVRVGHITKARE